MTRQLNWKEITGVITVLLILVGLPILLWYWRASVMPGHYPPETKIFTLTAVANGGIWTQKPVTGYDYWWRNPSRVEAIPLQEGDHVVLRLRSADVLHTFGIPLLRLGPIDVPAGHTVEVEFDASRSGVLTFLCWQVCSPDHPNLKGRFQVAASEKESW